MFNTELFYTIVEVQRRQTLLLGPREAPRGGASEGPAAGAASGQLLSRPTLSLGRAGQKAGHYAGVAACSPVASCGPGVPVICALPSTQTRRINRHALWHSGSSQEVRKGNNSDECLFEAQRFECADLRSSETWRSIRV